jgi:PmbA protein
MMDALAITLSRDYNLQDTFKALSLICSSYDEKVSLPNEKMPVVFLLHDSILGKFSIDLNAHVLGSGASMFSEKIGQKLFADHFSLIVDRNSRDSYQCFFDAEGTMLPNDHFKLIENGVLLAPCTAKKVAKLYGYAKTGSASGDYDSVPDVLSGNVSVGTSGKTIKELLDGRIAVYVVISTGGDFTSQGEYAAPVQSAFLFDGDLLLGRLPQIAIRSNIFDIFGKDFIGLATDGVTPHGPLKYLAMNMNVDQIGDWL